MLTIATIGRLPTNGVHASRGGGPPVRSGWVVLAVAALALGGCGHSGARAHKGVAISPAAAPSIAWRPTEDPPAQIPHAVLHDPSGTETVGEVVYWHWIEGGSVKAGELDAVSRSAVGSLSAGSQDHLDLSTAVAPSRVQLLIYDEVGANGLPTGQGHEMSCEPRVGRCNVTVNDAVRITFSTGRPARLVVLNASWYVPARMRQHNGELPAEVSAAWAFATKPALNSAG